MACDGEIDNNYTPTVSVEIIDLATFQFEVTYKCESMNECTTNRCNCDLEYSQQIAEITAANIAAGTDAVDLSNQDVEEDMCVKGLPGSFSDACCGDSPGWQLFNTQEQSCVAGQLQ